MHSCDCVGDESKVWCCKEQYCTAKDWCWNWNSNTLATWCEKLTHYKRPWCWKRLRAGGEGDDRGWNGWIASLFIINGHESEQILGDSEGQGNLACCSPSQRVRQDWVTEHNNSGNANFLGIPHFCPQRKEYSLDHWYSKHQSLPTKKNKTSFKGNILTYIKGINEDKHRKHSKCSKY